MHENSDKVIRGEEVDQSSQSLDDFPLPPGLISYNETPEFDHAFKFPPIKDPGQAYAQLRGESDLLQAKIALKRSALERTPNTNLVQSNPPASQSFTSCVSSKPPVLPEFPFDEFSGWDLEQEAGSCSDQDGEDLILPHTSSPESRPISSWCQPPYPPRQTSRPSGQILRPFRPHIMSSEHNQVLRETRVIQTAIVDAGFDFGFDKQEPRHEETPPDPCRKRGVSQPREPTNSLEGVTVSPPRRQYTLSTPQSKEKHNMNMNLWPRDTKPRTPLPLTDSGVGLGPLPPTPMSTSPRTTTFQETDLSLSPPKISSPPKSCPPPLSLQPGFSPSKSSPSRSPPALSPLVTSPPATSQITTITTTAISSPPIKSLAVLSPPQSRNGWMSRAEMEEMWNAFPSDDVNEDIGRMETGGAFLSTDPVDENGLRRKRLGFWGKAKSSGFLKKAFGVRQQ